MGQVAKDFDLTETAVRQWVTQAERAAGTRTDGLTTDERDELARLRRENRCLSEDCYWPLASGGTGRRTASSTCGRGCEGSGGNRRSATVLRAHAVLRTTPHPADLGAVAATGLGALAASATGRTGSTAPFRA